MIMFFVVVGLPQTVINSVLHLSPKQPLLSTATWQSNGSISLRCMSAIQSTIANKTLSSLQLVCFFMFACLFDY